MTTMIILNYDDNSVHQLYLGKKTEGIIRELYKEDYVAWYEECVAEKTGFSLSNCHWMITEGYPEEWQHISYDGGFRSSRLFSATPYDVNMP